MYKGVITKPLCRRSRRRYYIISCCSIFAGNGCYCVGTAYRHQSLLCRSRLRRIAYLCTIDDAPEITNYYTDPDGATKTEDWKVWVATTETESAIHYWHVVLEFLSSLINKSSSAFSVLFYFDGR